MSKLKPHWTDRSIEDFLYKITADFVQQIENYLNGSGENQTALAEKLGVTPGRVSQVLNAPGNLTLKKIVQYARALNKKVAIVAYDDNDPMNSKGPINAQVFEQCWIRYGRPADFFALQDGTSLQTYVLRPEGNVKIDAGRMDAVKANNSNLSFEMQAFASNDADQPIVKGPYYVGATNG